MENRAGKTMRKRAIGVIGMLMLGGCLSACTTVTPWTAGTVTSSHLYLHRLPVSGVREARIVGGRCTVRPLFFRQDATRLKQRAVIETLQMLGKNNATAEDVSGTLTTENRFLWTKQCVRFSATPVLAIAAPDRR